jgi:hypothetical protein
LLSTIFSIAIFEKRDEKINLKGSNGEDFVYFSKPYEPFCKENISFLLKYLASLNFESGLEPLISDSVIHESLYKHLSFHLSHNPNTNFLQVAFSLTYLI